MQVFVDETDYPHEKKSGNSHADTTHPVLSVTFAFALARSSAVTTRSNPPAAAKCSGEHPRSSRALTLESASRASTKGKLPDEEMRGGSVLATTG